ncbi:MAG: LLM class flavin-dependent oxidoreductase [Clostridia bacterium]|nr:LLM class flavin-dependent oxidoreductase [Clostridia bacterium]
MKFGVMELFQFPEGKTADQVLHETLETAQLAEELGFDSIWLAEHHFSEYGIVGSPLLMAAAIAARTKRIQIGTAVLVLPFYDPVRLAEECALVDVMSGGRLVIGYGRGYQPEEFRGFRINQSEARQRTQEIVDILKLAWTQDRFSYEGQFYQIKNVTVYPKPLQKPHPPLLQAAVSLDTFRLTGSQGIPILTSPNFTPLPVVKQQFDTYVNALREAGYDPDRFDRPLMQQVYIGDDPEDAYRTPEPYAMWYQRLLARLVPGGREAAPAGYENWNAISGNIAKVTYDQVFEHGAIFATPEDAIKKLTVLRDVVGVTNFIVWANFGGIDHRLALRSLERFARHVMPAFR